MKARSNWTWVAMLALAACGSESPVATNRQSQPPEANGQGEAAATPPRATAALRTADGTPAGTAMVTQGAQGLQLAVSALGLPLGEHGIHVHMVGRCDAPSFESAGSHWNPTERRHGLENPQGPHAGDMPNLVVGADGRANLAHDLGGTMGGLLDSDGSAILVHADVDDQRTDPSGNSGGRIACGVFVAG